MLRQSRLDGNSFGLPSASFVNLPNIFLFYAMVISTTLQGHFGNNKCCDFSCHISLTVGASMSKFKEENMKKRLMDQKKPDLDQHFPFL